MFKFLILLFLFISSTNIFSQSNKAKKTYEALQSKDFEKGLNLISELKEKNEEGTLIYFFQYKYFFSEGNPSRNLDSAYHYLKFASNQLKYETEKQQLSYYNDFAFGPNNILNLFDLIYKQAFQSVVDKKSIQDHEHFIEYYGDNKYKTQSIRHLDTLQFDYYKSFNSIDSLYRFKNNFKESKLLFQVDEQIVALKIDACDQKKSVTCFEAILKEFPKSKRLDEINLHINEIKDSLALVEFNLCKANGSIDCLQKLKIKYPGTKIISNIEKEIDRYYFNYYVKPHNIDSIAYFLKNFSKSENVDLAKSEFVLLFEDSIKELSAKGEVFEFIELESKFYPLVESYNLLDDGNPTIKEMAENIIYKSIEFTGLKGLSWYIEKYPQTKYLKEIQEEINRQNALNNVAFLIENPEYENSKFGLLNMTTGSLNFGYYLEDVKGFSNELAAVKYNGKWGFINKTGDIEIPFIFDEVNSFKTEITGVCENGVWYFIDILGNPISGNEYLKIGEFGDGLFNVKLFSGGWQYINSNEEVVSNENYYFATPFIKGCAAVSPSDGHIQIINTKFTVLKDGLEMNESRVYYGELGSRSYNIESFEYADKLKKYIINAQVFYSPISNTSEIVNPALANDFDINEVKFDETGQYLIDGRGIICYSSSNPKFDYSLKDGKIDIFLNLYGNYVHPFYPSNNFRYSSYSDNYHWENNNKTTYTIENSGQIAYGRRLVAFSRESILYKEDLGYGIKSREGKDLIKNASFNGFSLFINGIAIVESEGGAYLINDQGKKITQLYQSIERLNNNTFIVKQKNDTKYFLINDKDVVLSASYDIIENSVVCGHVIVKNYSSQQIICKEDYRHGLIEISGKVVIPVVYDKLITVPNQIIVEKYSNASQSKPQEGGSYKCNVECKVFNYYGNEIEVIPPGYSYGGTDSQNSYFHKSTYKPNSEQLLKRLIIEVPLVPSKGGY